MDITNCFVRSFDPKLQEIYDEVLRFADISLDKFPKWVHSHAMVGCVTESAAQELGLVPGVPVFGGCCDIPAIAVGSGSGKSGGAHIYFGTSGWVGYSVPHDEFDHETCPLDTELDICSSGMNAVGLALNWAIKRFYMGEWAELGDDVFSLVNQDVEQVPPGAEGLLCTPWFYGECSPLNEQVRGTFFGLGDQHDRRHMLRAVMEGICFSLKIGDEKYREKRGYAFPDCFYAIGGGSKSPQWMQMMADIFNVPVLVPYSTQHIGAVGTAYCALIGLGVCKDFTDASERVAAEYRYDPIPERVEIYRQTLQRFRKLYDTVVPLYTVK